MISYPLEALEEAFARCETAQDIASADGGKVVQLPCHSKSPQNSASQIAETSRPEIFDEMSTGQDMNAAAQAGLEDRTWFDDLSPADMNAFLRESSKHPGMIALADQPRKIWLPLLFALADADRRGATEAEKIAREWSRTSKRFNEDEFERDWKSFR